MRGECTCWVKYPNKAHKHDNGKWKCVDCYVNVRQLNESTTAKKTRCLKRELAESEEQNEVL